MAALSRENIPEKQRSPFNLYVDEFQNFATPSMNKLLTESRKYHIGSTIGHQTRMQLPETLQSTTLNVGSLVCFQLIAEDAKELATNFNLTPKKGERVQIVPRDCLRYLSRHPNTEVRAFYGDFLSKLERYSHMREETEDIEVTEEGFADIWHEKKKVILYADFGGGEIPYNPEDLVEIYTLIEKLFYEDMTRAEIAPFMAWEFGDELDEIEMRCSFILGYREYHRRSRDPEIDNIFTPPPNRIARKGEKAILDWWEKMKKEQLRFYTFQELLRKILKILREERIYDYSSEYSEIVSQQTFADRANEVVNELVHLKKGHARIIIPGEEHLIETIVPKSNRANLQTKKDRIVENTRKNYCKTRAEVEEEIRRRQGSGEPTPPITRKHPL